MKIYQKYCRYILSFFDLSNYVHMYVKVIVFEFKKIKLCLK